LFGTVGLSGEAFETGNVKALDAAVFAAGLEIGGGVEALGVAGFPVGLDVGGVVTLVEDGLTSGGLAGAPGTLVGREGAFNTGLLSSTLMVGLPVGAAGAGGFGFGFAGGKRKSGIDLARFVAGLGSLLFEAGIVGLAEGFAGSFVEDDSFPVGDAGVDD
jgi:hypothetical protein